MACGLWIPVGTLPQTRRVVEAMRREIALPPAEGQDENSFSVLDTRPIGGCLYPFSTPIFCLWEADLHDESQEGQVERCFGMRPERGSYSIGSYVDGDDAGRIVAVIAAWLAEQTGGVINFYYPLAQAAELPGRTLLIQVGGPNGSRETALDATAMRAWSRHPQCWMLL